MRGLTDVGVESLKMPVRIGTYETSFNRRIENSHDVSNDPIFSSCLGNLVSPKKYRERSWKVQSKDLKKVLDHS